MEQQLPSQGILKQRGQFDQNHGKKKKKPMLSQYARGLDKDKYDFSVAFTCLQDMHNKLNKIERKRDFFDRRLTSEQEKFYKTCILRNPDVLSDQKLEKKTLEMERNIQRTKLRMGKKQKASQNPKKKVKNEQLETQKALVKDLRMVQPRKDSIVDIANGLPDLQEYTEHQLKLIDEMEEAKQEKKRVATLLIDTNNDLSAITNTQFFRYMQDKDIVEELSMRLFHTHVLYNIQYNKSNPCSIPLECTLNLIKQTLPHSSKQIFKNFRNLNITQEQMVHEIKSKDLKVLLKGPDDYREEVQPEFMRSVQHKGLLNRLVEQKSRVVNKGAGNGREMDIFNNVDQLRTIETIPMGCRCQKSLLSKRNSLLLKQGNEVIAKKLQEAAQIEIKSKEDFFSHYREEEPQLEGSKNQKLDSSMSNTILLQARIDKQQRRESKLESRKKHLEELYKAKASKTIEDRLLRQDMIFLKRLQEDGVTNIVWQPRAKELIDLEDNRKLNEDMDRAEWFRQKMLLKKPRPYTLIKGYTTITKDGVQILKDESALEFSQTVDDNETLIQTDIEPVFYPMVQQLSETQSIKQETSKSIIQEFISLAPSQIAPSFEAISQKAYKQSTETFAEQSEPKPIRKEVNLDAEQKIVNLMRASRAGADNSDQESKQVLKPVRLSPCIKDQNKLGVVSDDIEASTQQSRLVTQSKNLRYTTSDFRDYINDEQSQHYQSQTHQINNVNQDSPSGIFVNSDKDSVHEIKKRTRSIDKFITYKENVNKIEINNCNAKRRKQNRFMSKIENDALLRKRLPRMHEVMTQSDKDINSQHVFHHKTRNSNSITKFFFQSKKKQHLTNQTFIYENEMITLPTFKAQVATTLRERPRPNFILPFYKRNSDITVRNQSDQDPYQEFNHVRVENQETVLRKNSAFTLNNSLPAPSIHSQIDSASGKEMPNGMMSEQQIISFNKNTYVSIKQKTEPYLQTIDVRAAKSGRQGSNIIPTFKDVFNQTNNNFPVRVQTAKKRKLNTNLFVKDELKPAKRPQTSKQNRGKSLQQNHVLTNRIVDFLQVNDLPVYLENKKKDFKDNEAIIGSSSRTFENSQPVQTSKPKFKRLRNKTQIDLRTMGPSTLIRTQKLTETEEDKQLLTQAQHTLMAEGQSPYDQRELDHYLIDKNIKVQEPYENMKLQRLNQDLSLTSQKQFSAELRCLSGLSKTEENQITIVGKNLNFPKDLYKKQNSNKRHSRAASGSQNIMQIVSNNFISQPTASDYENKL